jgi:rhamnosyltransferase
MTEQNTKILQQKSLPDSATRVCIFVHFGSDQIVAEYVFQYLCELHKNHCAVFFISNSEVSAAEVTKLSQYCTTIATRKNCALADFGAYQTGLELCLNSLQSDKIKTLILANDSVFGPIFPLDEMFNQMEKKNLDVWGVTDCIYPSYHLQSYFLAFNSPKNAHQYLTNFLNQTCTKVSKRKELISHCEVGLSQDLLKKNYLLGAYCQAEEIAAFEYWQTEDQDLLRIKDSISSTTNKSCPFKRKFFSWFSGSAQIARETKELNESYHSGIYGSW